MRFLDITDPHDVDTDWSRFGELLEGTRTHDTISKRYDHRNGWTGWRQVSVSLARDADGGDEDAESAVAVKARV